MLRGAPKLLDIEPNSPTLPTSIFFDFDARQMLFGTPANAALIDGEYGRFMRALKSVLGTTIMHQKRRLMDEQIDFIEIISRFLREIKPVRNPAARRAGRISAQVLKPAP